MKKTLLLILLSFIAFNTNASTNTITNTSSNASIWDKIKAEDLVLFYPGQSSWEWLLTKHKGAKSVRKGTSCMECHEGEEKEMGETLVTGKKLEANPIKNKPGSISLKFKSYYDQENLHVLLQWHENVFNSHEKMDKDYKTKITLMIGDEKVREFPVGGCWGVCHDDATNMRSFKGDKDRNLYTSKSRIKIKRTGGGDNFVDKDDLAGMLEKGNYLEYWQTAIKSPTEHKTHHGYILEKRNKQKHPSIQSKLSYNHGMWTVEISRALTPNEQGKINIKEDHLYTVGIALHDDFSKGRFHYISLPRSFSLNDSNADFTATKK